MAAQPAQPAQPASAAPLALPAASEADLQRALAETRQASLEDCYHMGLVASPPARAPRPQSFSLMESVRGKGKLNVLQGLALHTELLSSLEQRHLIAFTQRMCELGDEGSLVNRTYSAPRKWMRGKGRITVQLGCCYNYATDSRGNPPGILRHEKVAGLPRLLEQVITPPPTHAPACRLPCIPMHTHLPRLLAQVVDRMVGRGIFSQRTRPDTCIVNFYSEGDCIPPHIDHHDFTRPFVTLSLVSEQSILFGTDIKIVDQGEFDAPFALPLPVGSVLVLDGNGADVAKHCVPSVRSDRISITFRRIDQRRAPMKPFAGPWGEQGGGAAAAKAA